VRKRVRMGGAVSGMVPPSPPSPLVVCAYVVCVCGGGRVCDMVVWRQCVVCLIVGVWVWVGGWVWMSMHIRCVRMKVWECVRWTRRVAIHIPIGAPTPIIYVIHSPPPPT